VPCLIEWAVYYAIYWIAGLSLKIGDDLLDELDRPKYAWAPLTIAGASFGLLMSASQWDLALIVSIIIGVVVSGKVNRPQFGVGFVVIAFVILVRGLPQITDPLWWSLIVMVLLMAAAADEYGNDWADDRTDGIGRAFFEHRFVLKITTMVLGVIVTPFFAAAIGMWVLDTGYEIAGRLTKSYVDRQGYSTHP